jgi:hypothetical protein
MPPPAISAWLAAQLSRAAPRLAEAVAIAARASATLALAVAKAFWATVSSSPETAPVSASFDRRPRSIRALPRLASAAASWARAWPMSASRAPTWAASELPVAALWP